MLFTKKIIIIVTLNVKDKNKDTYRPFHGRIIDPVQYFPKIPIVYIQNVRDNLLFVTITVNDSQKTVKKTVQ